MPDISKCEGENCRLKENCWRYKAPDSLRQTYFMEIPYKDGKCEYYWPINKDEVVKDES